MSVIGIVINLWVICGYENLLGLHHIDALFYVEKKKIYAWYGPILYI